MRAHLGEPPLLEVGVAVEERARDRELEHAVAEELEALVGRRPVRRPGRVREDDAETLGRELGNQTAELGGAPPVRYWRDET